ncbi:aldehyde dehydrogenase [Natrarchaeobius sp. A-rgal3]|uniref:aldehyde dehydrogenase family protein n=1 Tax=Natrarchaeobius versutus TaxID=1679078 RepID=UPI00350F09B9
MTTHQIDHQIDVYVGGNWIETDGTFSVSDLTDGKTLADVSAASPAVARGALAAATDAEPTMSRTSVVERARWCESIAEAVAERRAELAKIIVREAGKPIASARSEVESTVERFRRAADEARLIASKGEFREGFTDGHEGWQSIVKPEPIGTVLCITPYNYPLATAALQVAPALAAGNSVVLKPASVAPVSTAVLTEIVDGVDGVPDGAFNYVPGSGSAIGDVLAGDSRINAIAMTGSSEVGRHIARESAIVTLHMELGGNAPALVFEDADVQSVAQTCAGGALKYAGQRCSAVSRILVADAVHDELVVRLDREMETWEVGPLFDEDTAVGPLISETHADRVATLVDDAVSRGASLVRGGSRIAPDHAPSELDSLFFQPTLLADVPQDARILSEEQFGPVAAVTRFDDSTEAIARANASELALDAAVFTQTYERALEVADRLDAGCVRINGAPSHGLGDVPFGGNGDSGIGREGIDTSIHELMRTKSIVL